MDLLFVGFNYPLRQTLQHMIDTIGDELDANVTDAGSKSSSSAKRQRPRVLARVVGSLNLSAESPDLTASQSLSRTP
ncbi:unnamed protein product [Linum trigynum]|uniref:Uncharacterized protein n=1 Tax=Linum trigynum TaxID=586398 RepID=A0AAV2GQ83_9ROSI